MPYWTTPANRARISAFLTQNFDENFAMQMMYHLTGEAERLRRRPIPTVRKTINTETFHPPPPPPTASGRGELSGGMNTAEAVALAVGSAIGVGVLNQLYYFAYHRIMGHQVVPQQVAQVIARHRVPAGIPRTIARVVQHELVPAHYAVYPAEMSAPLTDVEVRDVEIGRGEGGMMNRLYDTALSGGKISISHLQGLLNKSYDSKHPKDYLDYEVDKELSGQRVQVYKKKGTNEAYVVHRGTASAQDVYTDLKYALGYDLKDTNRYKHSQDIQRKAEAKYGANNISTLGHSLGSKLANEVGQNSKEVINLNPAYNIPDALKKTSDKTTNIRTQYDPVSFLLPLFKRKEKNTITLPSTTVNPLAEHTVNVLDRADPNLEVGKGFSKMKLKELKAHAKKLPKQHRIPLTRIKKQDLLAHILAVSK
jgi:hypothetical protein